MLGKGFALLQFEDPAKVDAGLKVLNAVLEVARASGNSAQVQFVEMLVKSKGQIPSHGHGGEPLPSQATCLHNCNAVSLFRCFVYSLSARHMHAHAHTHRHTCERSQSRARASDRAASGPVLASVHALRRLFTRWAVDFPLPYPPLAITHLAVRLCVCVFRRWLRRRIAVRLAVRRCGLQDHPTRS